VLILTSFVNERYAQSVSESLNRLPLNGEVLILYGHANDEDNIQQLATLQSYAQQLKKYLRTDIKLHPAVTTKRSHEKIVVSDNSDFIVGSWNVCSSNPASIHLETSLICKSRERAQELCSVIMGEVVEQSKDFLTHLVNTLQPSKSQQPIGLLSRLDSVYSLAKQTSTIPTTSERLRHWRKWRRQLRGLKDELWAYFDSPRLSIIRGEELRDVLIEQVSLARHSVLIATDRVNPTGLDSSLARLVLAKKKIVRIVWGIESPEWRFDKEPEVREELHLAADTLGAFSQSNKERVFTTLEPMKNHSKVLIVDDSRFLISSSNFLARGSEPKEESSSEIGILVESPLLARSLLGRFMLRYSQIFGKLDLEKAEGQPWDLFELTRQELESLWSDKEIEHPVSPGILKFAVESRFRRFAKDGTITDLPFDRQLNNRWEECMRQLGMRESGNSPKTLALFWEDFLNRCHEMIGIQKCYTEKSGTYTIRPKQARSPIESWSASHKLEAEQILKGVALEPQEPRESNSFVMQKYLDNFRIQKSSERT